MLMKFNAKENDITLITYRFGELKYTVNAAAFTARVAVGGDEMKIPDYGYKIFRVDMFTLEIIGPDGWELLIFDENLFSILYSSHTGKETKFESCFAFNFIDKEKTREDIAKP